MMTAGPEGGSVGPLREALTVCHASRMSGALRITGDPGGTIHLDGGLVTVIETPGAPSPEVLLLRSHRVTESRWDAAFAAAAAAGGHMAAELTERELVGTGELEALLRTALADAMFVLASGVVDEYRAEPGPADAVLPLDPGAEPGWLLAEASRRIGVLARLPLPPRYDRARIAAAPGAVRPGVRLGGGQDEIMALADGRRTPRDIAFALGRGVYETMLRLARMHEAGLLVTAAQLAAAQPAVGEVALLAPGDQAGSADGLPPRGKGAPGLPRRAAPSARAPDQRSPLGLLRPRSGREADRGDIHR